MRADQTILVAGGHGMIGRQVRRLLGEARMQRVLSPAREELDMRDQQAVKRYFEANSIDVVFLLAGVSGGIGRNSSNPARMIYDNLAIATNVIHAAYKHGVGRLLFVGSACAYPRICDQPIRPSALLEGRPEPTSEPFAVAKIAGIRMCQAYRRQYGCDFICAIPATCYGPGDRFNGDGHVVSALMERMHRAKIDRLPQVDVWGSGEARREFIYCSDLAEALILLMQKHHGEEIINIGSGADVSIAQLAQSIKAAVGYEGTIRFDRAKPEGMPRRQLECSAIGALGFHPRTDLAVGLAQTYQWYLSQPH